MRVLPSSFVVNGPDNVSTLFSRTVHRPVFFKYCLRFVCGAHTVDEDGPGVDAYCGVEHAIFLDATETGAAVVSPSDEKLL